MLDTGMDQGMEVCYARLEVLMKEAGTPQ
jgi:hypothetical protein